jgi:hypothetical protein
MYMYWLDYELYIRKHYTEFYLNANITMKFLDFWIESGILMYHTLIQYYKWFKNYELFIHMICILYMAIMEHGVKNICLYLFQKMWNMPKSTQTMINGQWMWNFNFWLPKTIREIVQTYSLAITLWITYL